MCLTIFTWHRGVAMAELDDKAEGEESECNSNASSPWYLMIRYLWENTNNVGLKRQLQSLKKELKGWEAMFERKHGHKPTKVCFISSSNTRG